MVSITGSPSRDPRRVEIRALRLSGLGVWASGVGGHRFRVYRGLGVCGFMGLWLWV